MPERADSEETLGEEEGVYIEAVYERITLERAVRAALAEMIRRQGLEPVSYLGTFPAPKTIEIESATGRIRVGVLQKAVEALTRELGFSGKTRVIAALGLPVPLKTDANADARATVQAALEAWQAKNKIQQARRKELDSDPESW